MGAKGWTILPGDISAYQVGISLWCCAVYSQSHGRVGAVSVLSGHLRGKTNTLHFMWKFFITNSVCFKHAVSSINMILAVIASDAKEMFWSIKERGKRRCTLS